MQNNTQLTLTGDLVYSSVQGEGLYQGTPSTFIRLSGCNLRCTWTHHGKTVKCDTPYSSFRPESYPFDIDAIVEQVNLAGNHHVVITGGEPYFQKNLVFLVDRLVELKYYVTIETNGTIYFPTRAQFYSVSPKFAQNEFHPRVINKFLQHSYQLKFVINGPEDVTTVGMLLKGLRFPPNEPPVVYLMPQAVNITMLDEKLVWLVPLAIEKGYRVADRLHLRLWGPRRRI